MLEVHILLETSSVTVYKTLNFSWLTFYIPVQYYNTLL